MNVEEIRNRKQLIEFLDQKQRCKYVFFWGHTPSANGSISKSCLSQWWQSDFVVDGVKYRTSEHFMMAEKARAFKDDEMLEKILNASSPAEAKKFGRLIKGFDDEKWKEIRFDIVSRASFEKFSQNQELKEFLLATGSKVLVEASPRDRIWGIGMGQNNEHAENPRLWRGLNLLGFALMDARSKILKE